MVYETCFAWTPYPFFGSFPSGGFFTVYTTSMTAQQIDRTVISIFQRVSEPAARYALFIVFFWFGALKVVGMSPASGLANHLLERALPFVSFSEFFVFLGFYECIVGLLFLFRGCERVVIPLLFFHMCTTFLPLFLLPQETWTSWFVPTMEGQYIIKNSVIIALAIGIASHLHPTNNPYKQESDILRS